MKKLVIILFYCLALAARAENVVSVGSVSGHPQDEVTLNVSLSNSDAVVAFQADIPLGSQLTYVSGSVNLNGERITDHIVSAAEVNGTLKIFAYSLSLAPFVGSEGNLLSFTLRLKDEPGDYTLDMGITKLSDASGTALPVTTQNGTVTILSPKLQINTSTLNYGHVPIRSEYTQYASVSNVGNEPLVITGITFSDVVFGCPNFTETTLQPNESAYFTFRFAPMVKGAVNATATVVSNSISGNGMVNLVADPFAVNEIHIGSTLGYCDSVVALPISMNNMEGIIGLQIEANLNDALEFVDFTLSDRKTDHVATGVVSGTTLRLMAYSPSGTAFADEDGVIGTVRFRLHGLYGNYYLNPFKAVLADANGEDVLSDKYQGYVTIRSPRISGNSSLDFGSSAVTETVSRDYVVYNNGNAQMRIDQVVFDQEGFAVSESFPITVGQYSSTTFHVSYSREQKGDFNALMKIYSNDPQNGLKNVALSGHRYEPNSIELSADPFVLGNGNVEVALSLNNYSGIVAMQANFHYPYENFTVEASDFHLTERFAGHSLYALPINDSTFRILVLSLQNSEITGHEGAALKVALHPVGTPFEEEYSVSVTDVMLSNVESEDVFTGSEAVTSFTLTITQAAQLTQGWNWWSTYIETSDIDALSMLENTLGNSGLRIQGKSASLDYFESQGMGYWYGNLNVLYNEQMYKVRTNAATNVAIAGRIALPSHHPITINEGWNWIGFPLGQNGSLDDALGGFMPEANDVIKGRNGSATFFSDGTSQMWYGTLNTMQPGEGYMYKSNCSTPKTLVYQTGNEGTGDAMATNPVTHEGTVFIPNTERFADNMLVTAVINMVGQELRSEEYELAAYVDGECRGSVKLMYVEPINRYVAFLLVYGEQGEYMHFVLTDGREMSRSTEQFAYFADATIGTLTEPVTLHFGTLGLENNMQLPVHIYPNPSMGVFNIEGVGIQKVEVIDTYGQVIFSEEVRNDNLQIDLSDKAAGAYLLRVVTDNGVTIKRLVKE